MSKRFIALATASVVLLLAAFFSSIPRADGVSVLKHSGVLMSSGTDTDRLVADNGGRDGASVGVENNLAEVSNVQNQPDDEYIAYRHVFAHVYFEAHRKDKPNQEINPAVEFYRNSVSLSVDEASVLEKIALETETKTLTIEEQAATIIRRFREKIDAEVKSGRKPSHEPPELQTLQNQRVKTTLQGRNELRKSLGEPTFSKFDTFIKEGLNLRIEKAIPSP